MIRRRNKNISEYYKCNSCGVIEQKFKTIQFDQIVCDNCKKVVDGIWNNYCDNCGTVIICEKDKQEIYNLQKFKENIKNNTRGSIWIIKK